jgi:hypothetical protein
MSSPVPIDKIRTLESMREELEKELVSQFNAERFVEKYGRALNMMDNLVEDSTNEIYQLDSIVKVILEAIPKDQDWSRDPYKRMSDVRDKQAERWATISGAKDWMITYYELMIKKLLSALISLQNVGEQITTAKTMEKYFNDMFERLKNQVADERKNFLQQMAEERKALWDEKKELTMTVAKERKQIYDVIERMQRLSGKTMGSSDDDLVDEMKRQLDERDEEIQKLKEEALKPVVKPVESKLEVVSKDENVMIKKATEVEKPELSDTVGETYDMLMTGDHTVHTIAEERGYNVGSIKWHVDKINDALGSSGPIEKIVKDKFGIDINQKEV